MALDWMLSPVTQGAMAAVGLGLALYLFCTLKIEMRAIERKSHAGMAPREAPAAAREIAELKKRLDELTPFYRESQEPGSTTVGAARTGGLGTALPTGLNLERRAQALRRHRRGETAEEIARSLAVPHEEVRLLIKVHKILMDRTAIEQTLERDLEPIARRDARLSLNRQGR